jgi:hypothetical protein
MNLVARKLSDKKMIDESLNVGTDGTVFLGECAQVALEFEGK